MGIMSKPPSKEYQDNYDKIFRKKEPKNKPRMLSEIERADLREDLKTTIKICQKMTKNEDSSSA